MSEPFNDLKQVEMSVKAAQKMVGTATMSMDREQLEEATQAIQDARAQLSHAFNNQTGVDKEFLNEQQVSLTQCEEQLNEAKQ
ncbi:hypothetical protein JOC85_004122 [Bacillus mesophilus]|uniref:DUF2564 family protein n=1 Tax=Bacillus mesophilus TaxID=1808955 RepID=A0A6M0QC05_9BACI|nr:DUF2564 family protein [Bacillus mesophilus]MBM7663251.1 hypothetical protein [Bacillus mesophilus]NEY73911.1 DUF2564 family protein [Bacillus mesophilus]